MKKATLIGLFIFFSYYQHSFAEVPSLPNFDSPDIVKMTDAQDISEDHTKNNFSTSTIPEDLHLPTLDEIGTEDPYIEYSNTIIVPEQIKEEGLPKESEELVLPDINDLDLEDLPAIVEEIPDIVTPQNLLPILPKELEIPNPENKSSTITRDGILDLKERQKKHALEKLDLYDPKEEKKTINRDGVIDLYGLEKKPIIPQKEEKKEVVPIPLVPLDKLNKDPVMQSNQLIDQDLLHKAQPSKVIELKKGKQNALSPDEIKKKEENKNFINREIIVLKLANDDMTLGQLTEKAEIKYMDFFSYSELYKNFLLKKHREIESKKVDKFIENTTTKLKKKMDPELVKLMMDDNPDFFLSFSEDDISYLSILAAKNGDLELMRLMIDNYYSLDIYDEEQNNLLMIAIINNNEQIISYLLHKGIDLNISNIHRETPLILATKKNLPVIVQMLKEAGSFGDVDSSDLEMSEDFDISF